ncbi:MAG: MalY/PatB family protein [Bacillota bacterium]
MKTDFSKYIDRKGSNSIKWDLLSDIFGSSDLLPMWVADSDWPTAPAIIKAIKARAEHGVFGYSFPDQDLKNIIVQWVKKHYNWEIKEEWIVFSNGVVPSLNIAVQSFTNNGDEVIIQPPVYYPFRSAIQNNGAVVVNNQLVKENGKYKFDFKNLKNILSDTSQKLSRAKLLILCNPHNPVGRVWDKKELKKLGEICIENNVKILSDEIHADFVYSNNKHISIASLNEKLAQNTLTFMAPSKSFNIAGLNSSFVIIKNENLRKEFMVNKNGLVGEGNIFGIKAMKAAYKNGEKWLFEQLSYLQDNMDYAVNYINEEIPNITTKRPEGTYLLWLDCRNLNMNDKELQDFFIEKVKVALDPGIWFGKGGSGFMRMNLACPRSTLKEGLEKLKMAVRGDN